MNVAIELPEDIERQLESAWPDLPRRVMEAIAIEGYRSGALSRGQVGKMLNMSYWGTEAFLKEKKAYLHYDEDDLTRDIATFERLYPK